MAKYRTKHAIEEENTPPQADVKAAKVAVDESSEALRKKRNSRARKLIIPFTIIILLGTVALLFIIQGIPTKTELLKEVIKSDPVLGVAGELLESENANYQLEDDKSLYDLSNAGRVITLLIEVHDKNGEDITAFETPEKADSLKLPAIVKEGTDSATVKWEGFGSSTVGPNATIEVKGSPKQNRKYHNFKIRLKDVAGQFEGQTILNLKKGYTKQSRIEEKFAFDLFSMTPNMMSLRTSFVHLYIKNASSSKQDYESYGLYTMVEQPDENYFQNRSLDNSALLYQAEDFSFEMRDEFVDVSEKSYNKKSFEKYLDIKQGDSHAKLLEMLRAVNDMDKPIGEVVEEYFDAENLYTWLAMNVILGNDDCSTSGYLIYKPTFSKKWFILPGNMSEAMQAAGNEDARKTMQTGMAQFSGNLLYERILGEESGQKLLLEKIDKLMGEIDEDTVKFLTNQYIPVLAAHLKINPDKGMLKQSPEKVIKNVNSYYQVMKKNVEIFKQDMQCPSKSILVSTDVVGSDVKFVWEILDIDKSKIKNIVLEISADPNFDENVIEKELAPTDDHTVVFDLPKGRLYWRIVSENNQGEKTGSINTVEVEEDEILYGMSTFMIL